MKVQTRSNRPTPTVGPRSNPLYTQYRGWTDRGSDSERAVRVPERVLGELIEALVVLKAGSEAE